MATCQNCGAKFLGEESYCPRCGAQPETVSCSRCRTEIPKDAQFCQNCGQKAGVQGDACPSCGGKVDLLAKFCPACGIALSNTDIPVSDKYAWTLATIPIFLNIVLSYYFRDVVLSLISAFIASTVFFILDLNELRRSRRDPNAWVWTGLIIVPVYLFIRASKTNKKYGYAITWCILMLISLML